MKGIHYTFVVFSTVALIGAGCASSGPTTQAPSQAAPTVNGKTDIEAAGGLQEAAFISMGVKGWNPSTITVKKGETVTWINEDPNGAHWPASSPHPAHTDYPEFDPKAPIAPGQSWSFKFDQVGTWRFHDHLNAPTYGYGTVTVTE